MKSTEIPAGQFEAVPTYCLETEPDVLGRVAIMYPSGNPTAIVVGYPQNKNLTELNAQIMAAWPSQDGCEIEQCCYVTTPTNPAAAISIQMLAGEFCGNATRSAVQFLTKGQNCRGLIEASGVAYPLEFEVRDEEVAVQMPLPDSGLIEQVDEGSLVNLDGISQLVVTAPPEGGESPRQLLVGLLASNKYGLAGRPAAGVCYYNPDSREAQFCVWVNAVDTMFDETACGSGTCAIGIAAAYALGESVRLEVIQPSGEPITTEARYAAGGVVRSFISGKVQTIYDGPLSLARSGAPAEIGALLKGQPVVYTAEGQGAPEAQILALGAGEGV